MAVGAVIVFAALVVLWVVYLTAGGIEHATAGCSKNQGFGISVVNGSGGQPTPLLAAENKAAQGAPGLALPQSGWHVTNRGNGTATIESGSYQLHAVQGRDGTWQIDAGYRCQ